ncbi:hypothetical protein BDF22DRAFT_744817 [Syncephalis plumigaleata]|nr:hypothetical protein BDF22DRAFT_744817 [Syncephalis plumigaleata]
MLFKQSLGGVVLLALANQTAADMVLLTAPANGTVVKPGEIIPVGFKVRLQGMSMLESVRLVLQDVSTGRPLGEILSSTRSQAVPQADSGPWQQQTNWTLPNDLPEGPLLIRAIGNASFPDKHGGRSRIEVEDRATVIITNVPSPRPTMVDNLNSPTISEVADTPSSIIAKDANGEEEENESNDITSAIYANLASFAAVIKEMATMELENKDE